MGPGHELFIASDFTKEEIDRENKLAIAVIDGGLAVCKKCREYESGLDTPCSASGLPAIPNIAPVK